MGTLFFLAFLVGVVLAIALPIVTFIRTREGQA